MQTQTQTQMQTPTTGAPKLRPRSGRTPLQLKNSSADPIQPSAKPKPKPDRPCFEILEFDKENNPVAAAVEIQAVQPPETSLAEELSAIKKKLERMRTDKERTEKTLNEKHAVLDAKMKEMEQRGEIQKNLEIEVDRLFRLKELKCRCMRVSPMRTLRAKEQEKIINEAPLASEVKTEETVVASESESESESVGGECQVLQSPGSACSQTHTTHTKSDN
ncbi:high mobility group B protein 6 [Spatholobus suberectus]|nr:high mobility group B protein 6 [Spatholobus suberectus]